MPNGIEVARAYVTIIPKTDGSANSVIKSIVDPAAKGASNAGQSAGRNFAGMFKKVIAAAGIGAALKKTIDEGAKLEQSIGGIETLFGTGGKTIEQFAKDAGKSVAEVTKEYNALEKAQTEALTNASKAYQTAGLSANDYMETVTSFAASLKASGLSELEAAKAADAAVIAMSDNANKMGTDMSLIQNAYQGFAKQNYTMLDNLKLGYGGTKTEMERLLSDAEKLSGQKYDISNLNDVYSAIQVIQDNLGITGTTAKEAATTLSGSFASMSAAAKNLMGNLALGQDVGPAMQALVESSVTYLGNLIPAIWNVLKNIPTAISTALGTALPIIGEKGTEFIQALTDGINTKVPELATKLPGMITTALNSLSASLPAVVAKGGELLKGLGSAIVANAPLLASAAAKAISELGDYLSDNLPKIAEKGGELLGELAKGIITHLPEIASTVVKIGAFLASNLAGLTAMMIKSGLSLIKGVASGITSGIGSAVGSAMDKVKSAITKPIEAAKETIRGILDKIKGFFPLSIGKIFSNLKLPHISVSGGSAPFGIGGKGSLPKFSVSWYKKAEDNPYIFKSATIFGAGEGSQDELLYGRQALMRDIEEASGSGEQITNTFYITVDGAEDPEDYADRFVREVRLKMRTA